MNLTSWLEEENRSVLRVVVKLWGDTENKPHNNYEKLTRDFNNGAMTSQVKNNKEV